MKNILPLCLVFTQLCFAAAEDPKTSTYGTYSVERVKELKGTLTILGVHQPLTVDSFWIFKNSAYLRGLIPEDVAIQLYNVIQDADKTTSRTESPFSQWLSTLSTLSPSDLQHVLWQKEANNQREILENIYAQHADAPKTKEMYDTFCTTRELSEEEKKDKDTLERQLIAIAKQQIPIALKQHIPAIQKEDAPISEMLAHNGHLVPFEDNQKLLFLVAMSDTLHLEHMAQQDKK